MLMEKLAKLINVKTIVTLLLTLVFCYLSVTAVVSSELFMTIFTVVIGFYFGNQTSEKQLEQILEKTK